MDVQVRGVGADELDGFWAVLFTAFAEEATAERVDDERDWAEPDRLLGAFDGGRIAGTAGAYSFDLTLPGGATIPVAGVTMVGVLPTHRRRGVLRAMMGSQLEDVVARGEAVAILGASEASIYGRFGYGLATRLQQVNIDTRGGLPLLVAPAAGGSIRMITPAEVRTLLPPLQDEVRRGRAGGLSRPAAWWEVNLRDREDWRKGASCRYDVVHERGGVVDGSLTYRVKHVWGDDAVPGHEVRLVELLATDPEVEAALLVYAAEIDLTASMTTMLRPVDDPVPYRLVDRRRYHVVLVHDDVYCRLLDVPVALSTRRYEGAGTVVLGVEDPFRPASGGRFRLDVAGDGTATCERVDPGADADIGIDAAALGSLFLGDVHPSQLAAAGRLRPASPEILALADRVFPTSRAPYCGFGF